MRTAAQELATPQGPNRTTHAREVQPRHRHPQLASRCVTDLCQTWMATRERISDCLLTRACVRVHVSDSLPSRVASFAGLDIFVPENKPVRSRSQCRRSNAVPDMHTHHRLQKPEVGRTYRMWGAWEDVDPFDSDKDTEDNQVRSPRRRQRAMQRVFRDNSHVRAWGWNEH
jgi:hypothetical protein